MVISLALVGAVASSGAIGETGAGYIMGGAGGFLDTVDRFSFPSDARTTLGTGLSSARHSGAGMSNSGVAGYAAGGGTTGNTPQTTVDKFSFSDDSRSTLGTGLSAGSQSHSGYANTGVAGYFCGGGLGSATDKFSFSDDSRSTGTTLSGSRSYMSAAANEGALA